MNEYFRIISGKERKERNNDIASQLRFILTWFANVMGLAILMGAIRIITIIMKELLK